MQQYFDYNNKECKAILARFYWSHICPKNGDPNLDFLVPVLNHLLLIVAEWEAIWPKLNVITMFYLERRMCFKTFYSIRNISIGKTIVALSQYLLRSLHAPICWSIWNSAISITLNWTRSRELIKIRSKLNRKKDWIFEQIMHSWILN